MNTFKLILRWIRRGFLCLFVMYWVCFVCGTIVKLSEGGLTRTLAWYRYVGTWVVLGEESGNSVTFIIHDLSWRQFLAIQATCLAITMILVFFEWRRLKHKS